ncbi:16S rRNA processing protein RimM [Alkalibaculum sp. M08DMB]|uniref:Ribosome maturation factor RimM n=1 Tax=Alkalibaculum sporogenes TaxID=2655001 RepID=A0A6A7K9S4_9FIRM|nr:16S rRNA processing protein RimM [Alkalibaculum sporogenes]
MNETLVIGKIGAPHGIKGEIKVFPLTDDPSRFDALKTFYIKNKEIYQEYSITKIKYQKSNLIVKLDGIDDRNSAEELKNKYVEIDRQDGIQLEEDEYYIVDLIGLKVYENDILLGELQDVIQSGGTDIYSIKTSAKDILIPAVSQYIQEIDMGNKKIIVQLPDGLKEL